MDSLDDQKALVDAAFALEQDKAKERERRRIEALAASVLFPPFRKQNQQAFLPKEARAARLQLRLDEPRDRYEWLNRALNTPLAR